MFVGEQSAVDLERLLVKRLGLGVLALRIEIGCQSGEAGGGAWVFVGKQPAVDLQRFLEQRLGLGVLSLREVMRQVVVAFDGVRVVVGEQLAADLERLLVERLGRSVLPLAIQRVRYGAVADGGLGV